MPFVKGFNVVPGPLGGVTRWLQDPPQPYESVDTANFLDFSKFDLDGLENPDAMGVTRSMDRMRAHLDSGTTAWERFQGAFDAGPGAQPFAHAQAAAIDTEFGGLRSALIAAAGSIDALKEDIQADGTVPDTLTREEIDAAGEIMRRVRDSGFTTEEVAALRAIGIDDAGLVQLRDDFGGDVETLTPSTSFVAELSALSANLFAAREAVDEFARQGAVYAAQTNTPPVAGFTASTNSPSLTASFIDTSTSPDLDSIVSRVWDFGDGEIAEGSSVAHTYAEAGTYTVTLRVSDGTSEDQAQQSVTVGNRGPEASYTWERDTLDPLVLHFDANGSSDPDGDSLTYSWNFHDGTFGEGETVSHAFTRKGFRVVTLTVSDGTTESSFLDTVHPGMQDPVARFDRTPAGSALAPYTSHFDASASSDPEGKQIVSYEWDFGDGSTATGKTTSHLIANPGPREITLTITTADGRTATTGQRIFPFGLSDLDLPVCGDQGDGNADPIVNQCPDFVPARGSQLFVVPGTGPRTITLDYVLKLGAFATELAAFKVDDDFGSIGALKPGDSGYEAAAFNRAQTIFPYGAGPATPDVQLQVNGGDRFGFMLIPGWTLDVLRENPTNDPATGPYAFFSLDQLNPDEFPHAATYAHKTDGSIEFGFEDILGGGDNDFDDMVYRVTGLDPVPGLVVTKTADDPTSTGGETNGYTVTIANSSGLGRAARIDQRFAAGRFCLQARQHQRCRARGADRLGRRPGAALECAGDRPRGRQPQPPLRRHGRKRRR